MSLWRRTATKISPRLRDISESDFFDPTGCLGTYAGEEPKAARHWSLPLIRGSTEQFPGAVLCRSRVSQVIAISLGTHSPTGPPTNPSHTMR